MAVHRSDDPQSVDPLAKPPGLLLNGSAVAMFVVAVWRGSERTGDLDSILLVAAAWFFVMLAWLFRFVAGAGGGTIGSATAPRWVLAPSLFAIAALLVFGGYAMGARFALSESELDRAADAVVAGQTVDPGWIGLYQVAGASMDGSSVRIEVAGQYAFVRDAPAVADGSSPPWYEPVHGRWSYEIVPSFID